MTAEERSKKLKGWKKAVRCTFEWAKEDETNILSILETLTLHASAREDERDRR